MSIDEETLQKKVIAMLRKVTALREIDLDQSFEEMGIDSIVSLELVMKLEREFNINIPDSRMGEMLTPRATLDMVRELSAIDAG
jgi:acyl carrier protein